ncbi:hypothetical protein F2Q69_00056319 [Brassica cretica]|uniref:Uncharacterized protein n=1 Tax=Brassica cretica TaxID=69181 RepID=A0A8S9MQQ3_BRACR|nr:hypothetical protein F2Q69_00056319 [Brassica cretica]
MKQEESRFKKRKVDGSNNLQLENNQIKNKLKKNLRSRKTHDDRKFEITMEKEVFALIPY